MRPVPGALRLAHLNLEVSDLSRSERFYADVLCLPVKRDGDSVSIRWGGSIVVLAAGTPRKSEAFHFGFCVADDATVDAWFERFGTIGIPIVERPLARGSVYVGRIGDPDGYPIEIYAERAM